RLAEYIRQFSTQMIGIVLGANTLLQLFDEKFYEGLEGGILEAFGRLFRHHTKLYAYPMKTSMLKTYMPATFAEKGITDELITAANAPIPAHLAHLYSHLLNAECIEDITDFNPECLGINSRSVHALFLAGDQSWKGMVPDAAAKVLSVPKK